MSIYINGDNLLASIHLFVSKEVSNVSSVQFSSILFHI